ncbi:hypothetical protein Acr_21g0011360 [Actinidia rufa]|uniref:Retrotransposon gag domain-containing protein n=1 Tax=Actinidia rufa TaxID=165716 RepID=A0A7J0GIA0_9ERIC|nr:hypothetical protein Acr_21g0011360 [Actinidia rufa]
MHLRSRNLPRPSASSPPGNRSHPMANPGQAPDLEGLHREIHDMAEQMRIMNENNGRLMQLLAAANPPLPAAPPEGGDAKYQARPYVKRVPQNLVKLQPGREGEGVLTEATISGHEISPPHKKIQDLDARLDTINTGTNAPVIVDTLIRQTEPPFTWRILRARISLKFKLPTQLGIYEGKTDPMDHLDSYKSLMLLQGCSDEVMCKAFSATLKGPARSWFRKLSPGTIDSFGDLSRLFVANFMSCKNRQKNASHLFTVHQKETESLKDFVKRFNQAILEVEDPSDKVIIMAMMEGLRPGPLFDSFSKSVPETLSALQSKADKYVAAEELAEAKRRRRGKDDHKRKQPDTRRNDYRKETRYKRPDRDPKRSNNRRPRTPPRRPEFILPPLNAPVAQVLSEIKHEEFVKWPEKIKTDPQKRNRNKYCEFHRDHGHNTEDYFQLKEQIADLIKRGYLSKYVADRPPPNSPERRCIPLELLASPSSGVPNQILQTEKNSTWMDEIIAYLQRGILPKHKLQARRLQYRTARVSFGLSSSTSVLAWKRETMFYPEDSRTFFVGSKDLLGSPMLGGEVQRFVLPLTIGRRKSGLVLLREACRCKVRSETPKVDSKSSKPSEMVQVVKVAYSGWRLCQTLASSGGCWSRLEAHAGQADSSDKPLHGALRPEWRLFIGHMHADEKDAACAGSTTAATLVSETFIFGSDAFAWATGSAGSG